MGCVNNGSSVPCRNGVSLFAEASSRVSVFDARAYRDAGTATAAIGYKYYDVNADVDLDSVNAVHFRVSYKCV